MNQPIRWLDDARTDSELRELLRAGSRPPPFPGVLLLSAALAITPKAALATSSLWSSTALLAIKATGAGLVIGLGSIAAVTAIASPAWFERPTSRVTTSVSTSARSESLGVERITPAAVDDRLDPVTNVGSDRLAPVTNVGSDHLDPVTNVGSDPPRPVAARAAAAPAATEASALRGSGIAAEAELLERARSQLSISPSRALRLIAQHEHEFVNGQLQAERELIAVDALLRLGRNTEAQRRAAPLLSDASNQVFAERLRNLLAHHQQ